MFSQLELQLKLEKLIFEPANLNLNKNRPSLQPWC